jgi:putative phosphoribosyl transferase
MFRNRTDAGEQLADRLAGEDLTDPVVLALPRGGVPVALPIAARLGAPLDLILVRKLGVPGNPELAAGALVEGADAPVFNPKVLQGLGLHRADFDAAIAAKRREIAARRTKWLQGRAPVPLTDRSVIVVDDGIATGATTRAALDGLEGRGAREVVLAVPVAPPEVLNKLQPLCTRILCLEQPRLFIAVGAHYREFAQVADDEVTRLLAGS